MYTYGNTQTAFANQAKVTENSTNYSNNNINDKNHNKKVTFNQAVSIFHVESLKEFNKENTYNEEEGFREYYANTPYGAGGKNIFDFNKLSHSYTANHNMRKKAPETDDCCLII